MTTYTAEYAREHALLELAETLASETHAGQVYRDDAAYLIEAHGRRLLGDEAAAVDVAQRRFAEVLAELAAAEER